MNCPTHGPLSPEWTSCPYCIRERQRLGGRGAAPPPPQPLSAYPSPPAAGVTRGPQYNAAMPADATRGGGGHARPAPADVTRGADGHDARGFGGVSAGHTRIIDPPVSAQRRIRAWLIQKEGPRPDQIYQVRDDETWIGRDPRHHVYLDDDAVSTQHAKLWVDDKRVLRLLNVSTSNGTLVNGMRVEAPVELHENDEIKVGTTVLVLKRIDAPIVDAPPAPASASARGGDTVQMERSEDRPPNGDL